MAEVTVSEKVKQQYEDLPYPARDPEDEIKRLAIATIECPDQLNHFCFEGTRDFSKPIRVLVAGGGTGDSAVQWAVALQNNQNAEIVYLDFSVASRKVAEARLAKHGLQSKVRFITDSLLNIPQMDLGKFDIVNCSGVLHHLADPEAGLKILADSLDEDGILVCMLYGEYGRNGVYPMQEIMRYINANSTDVQQRINNTKKVLNCFTPHNNFFSGLVRLGDYRIDEEVYDIFMHNQDRAYTVAELYDFAASANLKLVGFGPNDVTETLDFYLPDRYVADKELLSQIK